MGGAVVGDGGAGMMTESSGWERLKCEFFSATCVRVLGDYFVAEGFCGPDTDSMGKVRYREGDVFLEVGYVAEASPQSPEVVVGIGSGRYSGGRLAAVPLWYVVPEAVAARRYSLWTFKTEEELEGVLDRIRADILKPYASPLWRNRGLLIGCVERFRSSVEDAR